MNSEPLAMFPDTKVPSEDVTVCSTEPWLIQLTVVPTGTVTVPGWNEKSTISTVLAIGCD